MEYLQFLLRCQAKALREGNATVYNDVEKLIASERRRLASA